MKVKDKKPKYKIGDQVEIINYGSIGWRSQKFVDGELVELDKIERYDINPGRIGGKGIITVISTTQGIPHYSITPLGAWYYEGQMKLLHRPKYKTND